jgi:hypothetical protein
MTVHIIVAHLLFIVESESVPAIMNRFEQEQFRFTHYTYEYHFMAVRGESNKALKEKYSADIFLRYKKTLCVDSRLLRVMKNVSNLKCIKLQHYLYAYIPMV